MGNAESASSTNSTQGDDSRGHFDSGIYTDFFATLTTASGAFSNAQGPIQTPKDETSDSRGNNFSDADEKVEERASGINTSSLTSLFPSVNSTQSASKNLSHSAVNSSSSSATSGNSNTNSISSAFDSRKGTSTIGGDAPEEDGDIVILGNFDVEDEGSTDEELGESSRPIHSHGTARNSSTKKLDLNTEKATDKDSKNTTTPSKDSAVQQRRWSRHSRASIRRARTEYAVPEHLEYAFNAHTADRLRLTFAFYDKDGSGAIDRDELAQVMAKFDLDVTKQKLDALMLEADTSIFWNPIKMHEMGSIIIHPAFLPCKETTAGNGEIDFGEFCTLMASNTGRGAFAELTEQVDRVAQRRSAGDPCFAPHGGAGTCVLVVNMLGCMVSVFALFAVAWAPSSLNGLEEEEKKAFGWAWTRESMSLQADLVKTLKWLKVSEVHTSGGAGLALTYGAPLVLLAVFSLPLLCCTRGPLDYYFVQRLQAFVAMLLGLVLAVSNDYPTLNGSSHGASSRDRHRRWLYWIYYAALAMLLASYWALSMAANKFEELMSSDVAAAQALKEKLAKLEDQERAENVKAHATKTSSPRKQWSSPLLLNQETTVSRTRDEMPPLSLNGSHNSVDRNDGRPSADKAKFKLDAASSSMDIEGGSAFAAGSIEKQRVDRSSSMESPALEAVVESVTTPSSPRTLRKGELDRINVISESERKAARTTFAGGSRTRLGDRMSKDTLRSTSKSREKVPGLSLDAPLPALPFTYLELETHGGDGSRGTLGGDNSGSRVGKKEVAPRKSSLKVRSSVVDSEDKNALLSESRGGPSFHARFKLTDSPSNHPVDAQTTSSSSSSSRSKQRQQQSPNAGAPAIPRKTRERLVSSQLDITKWQKQRMEQGQEAGRIY